jgi:pyrroline-5-carboxylate reductase
MKILLVGCGKMGGALMAQWSNAKHATFTIVDPAMDEAPHGVTLKSSSSELDEHVFDIIIVAIKPQLIDKVLPEYKARLSVNGVLASIAAGCSVSRLQIAMGDVPVIRIMPNLPSEIGKGVCGLFASPKVEAHQRSAIENLMTLAGTAIWVEDEDGLDRITAIAGSGPGYVFEIARTYVHAAVELGFSQEEARALVLGTLSGTIAMAQSSDQTLEVLRDNVTSKNGTTHAGLVALNGDETLTKLMKATTQAAYKRAIEMR